MSFPTSNGYAPNGDVLNAIDSVNGTWSYAYDDLNRLIKSSPSGQTYWYSYDYDRFGNRWDQSLNGTGGPSGNTFSASFSGGNNRMDGYSYDAAGNLRVDNAGNQYTYDAEGRIIKVVSGAGTSCYLYDAEGLRVRKDTGSTNSCADTSTGTRVDYLYDLAGHEITEVSSSGAWNRGEVYAGGKHIATYSGGTSGTTYFIHADWLGTERARSTVGAAVCETITSLPFGDGQNITTTCSDPSPMHFTGKQRDTESGLDDFGARYDSSGIGRFMTPDPKILSIRHVVNPQKWNKYAYVLNNPLGLFDPNGMEEIEVQLRAFIPQKSVTVLGTTNGGDNRAFSTAANASSRTSITVIIETDASKRTNPIISVNSVAGQSTQLDKNGNITKTDTATQGLPTVTGARDANGSVVLNFQQDTKNPLGTVPAALEPGISANLNVTIPQSGSSVTAAGTTSGFPSMELNVTPEGQPTTNLPLNNPGPNGSAWSLFGTNNVLVSQPLPPPPPPCAQDKDKPCH